MKNFFKKGILKWLILTSFIISACDYNLNQVNPNSPTPDTVLKEEGLKRVALGMWQVGGGFFEWVVWQYHEMMGDNLVAPWVNFNFLNTAIAIEKVAFSDGSNVTPAANSTTGRTQTDWINFINTREDARGGGVQYEWQTAYGWNNEANLILRSLENGVTFVGNAAKKDSAYKAWAYFWKGYSYSRIGLLYEQGLIIDAYLETNNDYKSNVEIIAESNRMFELAIDYAPAFDIIRNEVIPAIFPNQLSGAALAEVSHTLIARNLLSIKERSELTNSDWNAIKTHATEGISSTSNALIADTDDATYLQSITLPWRIYNGWSVASARLVQAFSTPGDQRFTNSFYLHGGNGTYANSVANPHINSIYQADVPYASVTPLEAPLYYASYEENLLILAEAELALGNPTIAADYVDEVRTLQGANLPPLGSATWADIKKERKAALFTRGVAFYDLRRSGEMKSEAEGSGAHNVWVYRRVDDDNNPNTPNVIQLDENASIYYDYLHFWPVPDHETTFNPVQVNGNATKANAN
jgi:hypothetical protein